MSQPQTTEKRETRLLLSEGVAVALGCVVMALLAYIWIHHANTARQERNETIDAVLACEAKGGSYVDAYTNRAKAKQVCIGGRQ